MAIAATVSLPLTSPSRAARLSSVPALRSSFLSHSSSNTSVSIRASIAPRNPRFRISMTLQAPEKSLGASSFLDRRESGVLHFVKYHGLGNDFILMCGNGVRCFARFIAELENLQGRQRFTVHTGAGLIVPEIQDDGK
ncbi:hypothetical protein CRG98_018624, partial [Punica granatum]